MLSNLGAARDALQLRAMSTLRYLALMPRMKRMGLAADDHALQRPCAAKLGGFRVEHSGGAGSI